MRSEKTVGKKILVITIGVILAVCIGFGAAIVVQNGGFSGLVSFVTGGGEEAEVLVNNVVTVGQNTANVYEKADENSAVIYYMNSGETATCIEQTDKWVKLEIIDGVYGYAHAELFSVASEDQIQASQAQTDQPAQTAAPENSYVTPNVNVLDLYSAESADSQIVASVEYGEVLALETSGETWSKVSTLSGVSGYVPSSDIKATEYDPNALVVEVTNSFVNVRAEATSDSDKIGSLNRGDTVEYIGEEAGFYHIRLEDGKEGYVSMEYTERKNISETNQEESEE